LQSGHSLIRHPNPHAHPRENRTAVTLAYRAAYLAFSSAPAVGLGGCVVGSYYPPSRGQPKAGESLFSALLWRSGLIAMVGGPGLDSALCQGEGPNSPHAMPPCAAISPTTFPISLSPQPKIPPPLHMQWWYPSAFPLLLCHHIPVQALFLLTYAARLSRAACRGFDSVQHGAAAVRMVTRAMRAVQQVLFAAHGGGGAPASFGGGEGDVIGCEAAVVYVQFVLGALLPTFVVYVLEARARAAWLRRERAALRVRRWAAAVAAAGVGGGGAAAAEAGGSGSRGAGALDTTAVPAPAQPTAAAVAAETAAAAAADDLPGLLLRHNPGVGDDYVIDDGPVGFQQLPAPPSVVDWYLLVVAAVAGWLWVSGQLGAAGLGWQGAFGGGSGRSVGPTP
jgi:hypothetical protein